MAISADRPSLSARRLTFFYLSLNLLAATPQGDYDHFEGTRAESLRSNEKMRESQEKTRAHMQAFIDRFRASANRAAMVQSRVKAMGRMEVRTLEIQSRC